VKKEIRATVSFFVSGTRCYSGASPSVARTHRANLSLARSCYICAGLGLRQALLLVSVEIQWRCCASLRMLEEKPLGTALLFFVLRFFFFKLVLPLLALFARVVMLEGLWSLPRASQ
jgi:hypothetical protein